MDFPLEAIFGNQDQFTIYRLGISVFCQVDQQKALAKFVKGRLADIRTSREIPDSHLGNLSRAEFFCLPFELNFQDRI